jgi:hypothetical protein
VTPSADGEELDLLPFNRHDPANRLTVVPELRMITRVIGRPSAMAIRATSVRASDQRAPNADYACLDECLRCLDLCARDSVTVDPVQRQVWSPRASGPGSFNAARIWLSPSIRQ